MDLPLVTLAVLLAVVAVAVTKQKSFLLFAAALTCLTAKQSAFYFDMTPTPMMITCQQWLGTLGWFLKALFALVSIRRRSSTSA